MAEKNKGDEPEDLTRINIHAPCEVAYWMSKFAVDEKQLRHIVRQVGYSILSVEAYLKK